jgi:gluconolactonase
MIKGLIFASIALFAACSPKIEFTQNEWEMLADGQKFPEGPAWDGAETVYHSNCYGDWISRFHNGVADTFITNANGAFRSTNGLHFYDGFLYACDFGLGQILKISPDGKSEALITGWEGRQFNRPNDIIADKKGNLWFSNPKGYGKGIRDGRLFRYHFESQTLTMALDSLAFPNGLAISKDGKYLYLAESALESVFRWKIGKDGSLSEKTLLVQLPGGDPDGLEIDRFGNILIAHFGGAAVYVISPAGEILEKIPTPGKKPTNLEIAGKGKERWLYLTETETNALYRLKRSN